MGGNNICPDCTSSTIVCGSTNTITGTLSTECTIGAGYNNLIKDSPSATIVGGIQNTIENSNAGSIGGGQENQVTGDFAVVGGGSQNIASGQGSVIPGGQKNKASGEFSIAFGRKAEAKDDRSLVINLQEGGKKLQSDGASTFSAAATRFIFQIGQVKAVLDSTSILELDAVLNPSGGRRTLRSTTHSMMTPTRIRELIQEQKKKHKEEEDSGRLLEPGNFATEEQGKKNKASGAYSVVNGGEKNKAKGDFSVIGGGLKNTAFKTSATV